MRWLTSSAAGEDDRSMTRTYRIVLPLLGAWLAGWMYLSWPAIQDDALIHLRYADNLFLHHFVTYDGVHPDYGASSLLYVALLALLRGATSSPDLPRAVSSLVHVLLFLGFAYGLAFKLPKRARVARLAGLVLLILLVTPSAVRWLDDGMETGIVVLLTSLLAWQIHERYASEDARSGRSDLLLGLLASLAVMLRTELALLCGFGFVMLALGGTRSWRQGLPLLIGAGLAFSLIVSTMHVLLPDTALAKSHGLSHWFNPLHDAAITLGGAMSFGLGMLGFWLLTFLLSLLHCGGLSKSSALANAVFPAVLTLASLRGQEIQGVRYFAWTFFFPVVWNLLELARPPQLPTRADRHGVPVLIAFSILLAGSLPFESVAMHRVLTRRAETMRNFEAQHLDVLQGSRGIASDIGYIGYFTRAKICDLAGLVNGRPAARMTSLERAHACVRTDADFIFGNLSQLIPLMPMTDVSQWKVCGSYDFANVKSIDTHYLLVRPGVASAACAATARSPEPIESILPMSVRALR